MPMTTPPNTHNLAADIRELEDRYYRLADLCERLDTAVQALRSEFDQRLSTAHMLGKLSDDLYSATEIAERLHLSRARLYQLMAKGGTPAPRIKSPIALYHISDWLVWDDERMRRKRVKSENELTA